MHDSNPDSITVPYPVQSGNCCCHDPDADICCRAAVFGNSGSQVLKVVDLLEPSFAYVQLCFAVNHFIFSAVSILNLFTLSVSL